MRQRETVPVKKMNRVRIHTTYTYDTYTYYKIDISITHPVILDMIQSRIGSERVTIWEYLECVHSGSEYLTGNR